MEAKYQSCPTFKELVIKAYFQIPNYLSLRSIPNLNSLHLSICCLLNLSLCPEDFLDCEYTLLISMRH